MDSPVRGADWNSIAVRVEGQTATLLDVVMCGVQSGVWQRLERETAVGLALEVAGAPTTEIVRQEMTAFRYAHKLISADDFRGWLAARSLRLADVERYVIRKWLRDNVSEAPGSVPPDLGQLMVDALCSGALHRCATLLGRQLVAALGVPKAQAVVPAGVEGWLATTPLREAVSTEELRAGAGRAARCAAAHEQLQESLATPASLQACLAGNSEGWVRVDVDVLRFARQGQAREARLLLLEGQRPERLLGYVVSRSEDEVFLEDAEPALQVELLRHHAIGDVVVWPGAGSWQVATVLERTLPTLADPRVVSRARQNILNHELTRRGAGKVSIDAAL